MSEDERHITLEKIFEAVRRCRSGEISGELAETLEKFGLLRGVMHIGPAPKMRIVFASALKGKWKDAEKYLREKLPSQASLRYAATFNVDFVISGQLPDKWTDNLLCKKSDLFDDVYEAEVSPVKRYRWTMPKKPSAARNKAKLRPSLDDIANFLNEPKQTTQFVYDSSRLPSLSCLALITVSGKDLEDIWERLDEHQQRPVRDIFTNHGDKARMDARIIDRDVRASGFALCEFDSIGMSQENGGFKPAMNQAYEWRRSMLAQRYIEQVRMMPCAVVSESIDYYDELDEINSRIEGFKPVISLPYRAREAGAKDEQISFPVWNTVICGGAGSGKSVYAYLVAASLLKEHKFDVVYVNYKKSDETEIVESPRNEALEFGKIIGHVAQKGIGLARPADLEKTISYHPADQPGAWYTDCAKDDRVETVLEAIGRGRKERINNRGLFVIFDEIINQKRNLKADIAAMATFVNQMRSLNGYLGVIHQDLTDFWKESASNFIERCTVVLGSSLTEKDEEHYKSLSSRADNLPYPVLPVTFSEIKGFQKREGRFVFLPNQSGNSEHPLRHMIPDYSFLRNQSMPEEWQWGFNTPPFKAPTD